MCGESARWPVNSFQLHLAMERKNFQKRILDEMMKVFEDSENLDAVKSERDALFQKVQKPGNFVFKQFRCLR